jgi:hypothetical protein
MVFAFVVALATARFEPSATPVPAASAAPTPAASASPVARAHSLTLAIPPGWARTESGHYNEWLSPDGTSDFRVTVMPASPDYKGAGATDAVRASFQQIASGFNPKVKVVVTNISVCNGEQAAYRVDDPLGLGSAGFMIIVPGSDSAGLIN